MNRRNFLRNLAGGLALAMLPFVREVPPHGFDRDEYDQYILDLSDRLVRESVNNWLTTRYGVTIVPQ